MSTKFLSPGWRMPRNANQSKSSNYSMDFDAASSDYIDFTGLPDFGGGSLSISFWIKSGIDSSNAYVLMRSGFSFYIFQSGTASNLRYRIQTSSLNTINGGAILDNNWHHCVMTFDSTANEFKVFEDGNQVGSTVTTSGSLASSTSNVYLATYSTGAPFKSGQFDGLSFFDYALSASQVTTLYGDSTNGVGNPMALPIPPVAYYPLGTSAYNGEYLAENNAIGDYVFDFDGSNGYVDYGYTALTAISGGSSTLTTSMTISIWFKLNNATSEKGLIYFGDLSNNYGGFTIRHYASKFNFLRGSSHIITGGYSFTDTTSWHNMTLVYDPTNASNCYLYIDGSDTGVTFNASVGNIDFLNSNLSQRSLIIGTYYNTSYIFNGEISNVQIFNTALSLTDVETLYNYGSPIKTLANIPQSSNLKAWYKLDASEVYNSTTTEWSVDNNQNPSAYASSLDFDSASSDYIDCGNNSSLYPQTGDMSYSFWVNPDILSGLQTIYGRTAMSTSAKGVNINLSGSEVRVFMGVGVSGQWGVNTGGGTGGGALITSNSGLTVGQWSHVALTLDRDGDGVIYINGVPVVTAAMNPNDYSSVDIVDSRSNLIGNGNAYSNVKISNMSVWNTSLTSAQVTELYNNGTPSNLSNHSATSNLISWWKLNNTTTGIEDAKGSNDGTNNGATEYAGFVNVLAGDSSGMDQANLVQSDLQTVAPYSKYAMDFDGTADYIDCGDSDDFSFGDGANDSPFSYSTWVNMDDATSFVLFSKYPDDNAHTKREYRIFISNADKPYLILYDAGTTSSINYRVATNAITSYQNQWINLTFTYDGRGGNLAGDGIKIYLNGSSIALDATISSSYVSMHNTSTPARIGRTLTSYPNGKISNCSLWNTALTSAQVSEIYNEGLPGNLNSHSAYSNLISWWQLGENSSFDGNDWIVADEKGTNNGTSVSMPVGALVNGVGTTANGVSSGMSEGNLVGDAPYSTANALSTNMVVTSRVSGSGNTP